MATRKPAARKPAARRTAAKGSGGNAAKYQEITDRMVAALESGTVPWRKPWVAGRGAPTSMSTGKPYRGINVFLTGLTALEKGYESPFWGTYGQIAERAGMVKNLIGRWTSPDGTARGVRAGEKATTITFWKTLERDEVNPATGERETKQIPMLRSFAVFNAEQAEGLPAKFYPQAGEVEPAASAEQVLSDFYAQDGAPKLAHDAHGRAFFNHTTDAVHMPPLGEHESAGRYYSTAFHETTHATGHHSRLARREAGELIEFGSHDYGQEELVAEMGAAMLCAETGVDTAETTEQSAAYLASWVRTIKGEPRMVVSAAAAAQRAVDLVLEPQRQALPEPEQDAEPEAKGLGTTTEREIEAA